MSRLYISMCPLWQISDEVRTQSNTGDDDCESSFGVDHFGVRVFAAACHGLRRPFHGLQRQRLCASRQTGACIERTLTTNLVVEILSYHTIMPYATAAWWCDRLRYQPSHPPKCSSPKFSTVFRHLCSWSIEFSLHQKRSVAFRKCGRGEGTAGKAMPFRLRRFGWHLPVLQVQCNITDHF